MDNHKVKYLTLSIHDKMQFIYHIFNNHNFIIIITRVISDSIVI